MSLIALYGRAKRSRSYNLISVGTPEAAGGARSAAYRTREYSDVEDFPVAMSLGVFETVKTAALRDNKRAHALRLLNEALPRAAEALAGAVKTYGDSSKVSTGTDYGLALAVADTARMRGSTAYVVSMTTLFAGTPTEYEVSIGSL